MLMSDVRYQFSYVRFQISEVKYQLLKVKCQMSKFRSQTWDVIYQILYVAYQMADVGFQMSDVKYQFSDVRYSILDGQFRSKMSAVKTSTIVLNFSSSVADNRSQACCCLFSKILKGWCYYRSLPFRKQPLQNTNTKKNTSWNHYT